MVLKSRNNHFNREDSLTLNKVFLFTEKFKKRIINTSKYIKRIVDDTGVLKNMCCWSYVVHIHFIPKMYFRIKTK